MSQMNRPFMSSSNVIVSQPSYHKTVVSQLRPISHFCLNEKPGQKDAYLVTWRERIRTGTAQTDNRRSQSFTGRTPTFRLRGLKPQTSCRRGTTQPFTFTARFDSMTVRNGEWKSFAAMSMSMKRP